MFRASLPRNVFGEADEADKASDKLGARSRSATGRQVQDGSALRYRLEGIEQAPWLTFDPEQLTLIGVPTNADHAALVGARVRRFVAPASVPGTDSRTRRQATGGASGTGPGQQPGVRSARGTEPGTGLANSTDVTETEQSVDLEAIAVLTLGLVAVATDPYTASGLAMAESRPVWFTVAVERDTRGAPNPTTNASIIVARRGGGGGGGQAATREATRGARASSGGAAGCFNGVERAAVVDSMAALLGLAASDINLLGVGAASEPPARTAAASGCYVTVGDNQGLGCSAAQARKTLLDSSLDAWQSTLALAISQAPGVHSRTAMLMASVSTRASGPGSVACTPTPTAAAGAGGDEAGDADTDKVLQVPIALAAAALLLCLGGLLFVQRRRRGIQARELSHLKDTFAARDPTVLVEEKWHGYDETSFGGSSPVVLRADTEPQSRSRYGAPPYSAAAPTYQPPPKFKATRKPPSYRAPPFYGQTLPLAPHPTDFFGLRSVGGGGGGAVAPESFQHHQRGHQHGFNSGPDHPEQPEDDSLRWGTGEAGLGLASLAAVDTRITRTTTTETFLPPLNVPLSVQRGGPGNTGLGYSEGGHNGGGHVDVDVYGHPNSTPQHHNHHTLNTLHDLRGPPPMFVPPPPMSSSDTAHGLSKSSSSKPTQNVSLFTFLGRP